MLFASSASAFETSFWVWQRSEPLSEPERAELAAQGVRTIYWQIGELENVGEAWRWKARFVLPQSRLGELIFVPVVRLESREKSPFSKTLLESLLGALSAVAKGGRRTPARLGFARSPRGRLLPMFYDFEPDPTVGFFRMIAHFVGAVPVPVPAPEPGSGFRSLSAAVSLPSRS
jgi:hypothetical protein